jgi:hypothetical protein
MVFGVKELAHQLSALTGVAQLLLIAAYPRAGHSGELESIGSRIDGLLAVFSERGDLAFRIMHGQGAVLGRSDANMVDLAEVACRDTRTTKLEVRAVIIDFENARDSDWLDEALGELSLRSGFGSFTRDRIRRFVDDHWLP